MICPPNKARTSPRQRSLAGRPRGQIDLDYNMILNDLKNKNIAILGLGIEGLALVDFLKKKNENLKITLLDKASEEELKKRVAYEDNQQLKRILENLNYDRVLGPNYMDNLKDFEVVFRSPGIPYYSSEIQEAISAKVAVLSQIKLFFELCPASIIGVTGTKGKGTTASLIFEILQNNFQNSNINVFLAGNIGESAITLSDKIKPDDWVILELSSFQLQDLKVSPKIAVITNIAVDHLDHHKNESEYVSAKGAIVKFQVDNDTTIANKDFNNAVKIAELSKGKKLYFSGKSECDAYVKDDRVYVRIDDEEVEICSSKEINLVGKHNLENIAASTLACIAAGAKIRSIKKGVKEFKGLPHRLELVGEVENKKFYNDSFATNPEPTIAAIKSFKEPITIILGGSSKGADFTELAKEISDSTVNNILLIGDEAKKIKSALAMSKYSGEIFDEDGVMKSIVKKANEISKPKSVIILSPACASFGLFKNYKERGILFVKAVKELT